MRIARILVQAARAKRAGDRPPHGHLGRRRRGRFDHESGSTSRPTSRKRCSGRLDHWADGPRGRLAPTPSLDHVPPQHSSRHGESCMRKDRAGAEAVRRGRDAERRTAGSRRSSGHSSTCRCSTPSRTKVQAQSVEAFRRGSPRPRPPTFEETFLTIAQFLRNCTATSWSSTAVSRTGTRRSGARNTPEEDEHLSCSDGTGFRPALERYVTVAADWRAVTPSTKLGQAIQGG